MPAPAAPVLQTWQTVAIRAALGLATPASLRVAVVTNRFDRTAFHRFFAFGLLFRRNRLLEDETVTAIFVAGEIIRRSFAAEIAVNALVVHVKFTGNVIGIFIRK